LKRITILLFFAVLACAAVALSLLSSQQGASADPALSLDSVDIGENEGQAGWPCSTVYSTEETNHSAADWGISVWKACGGNYGFPSQSGDATARVTWQGLEWDGSGSQVDGTNSPEASVTLTNLAPHQLGTLVIEVLDGQGSNSFDLSVNGTLVYTYHSSTGGGEHWVVHSIDLVNPANSSYVHPNHIDDYYVAGTGIDPCTTTLVVEIENHGPAWSGWYSWGQLAVTYLELFAAEPSTICEADVKIVDQWVDAPAEVAVSENVPITVHKLLHNNGPYGPIEVEVGAVIDSVNIGYDSPACPSPYSADENDHAAYGWGEDVATACTGGNYGGGSDDGNSRLAWYLNELPSSANDTREASVTLTNPGFQLGILRTNVLDGQAGSNSFELRVNGTLVYTYHSDPSTAEFWVVHSIDLVNPVNSTVDVGNGTITAGTGIDPFTDSLEIEFTVLGDKWSGFDTWGQLAVSWVQLLAGSTMQVPLDVSVETPVEEHLVIHCSEASTHVFPFENTILRIKDEHVVDSDLGNNTMAGQITVDCIGTANPKIVSQQIDAPSQVAVSENVPVTVSKVLHNNGPYGPVEVEVGAVIDSVNIGYDSPACPSPYSADETAHAADGWGEDVATACTGGNYGGGSDDGDSRLVWYPNELPSGSDREASVTLTNPGFQLGILRTNVLDGQAGSNSFELRVNDTLVYTYHSDPSTAEFWVVHSIDLVNPGSSTVDVGNGTITPGTGIGPFTDSLEIEFTVLGDKWSGFDTWGQLAVSWVQLLAGETYQEVLPLPVSTEVVVEEQLVIHCSKPSTNVFPFENTILRIKDEHVVDSDLGNNMMAGQITVACLADVEVEVSQEFLDWPENINVSEQVPITLRKTITATVQPPATTAEVPKVFVDVNKTAVAPDGCTVDPIGAQHLQVEVLTTEPTVLDEVFLIHCIPSGPRTFTFTNEVSEPKDPHISDPTLPNEAETQEAVTAWAEVDVEVSQTFLDWPDEIDVSVSEVVTLQKTIKATVQAPATTTDIPEVEVELTTTAAAPDGCTAAPVGPAVEQKVVPTDGAGLTFQEQFTIHCFEPSTHGPFTFDNVVGEPKDPHISDPDGGNNAAHTERSVDAIGYSDLKVAAQYMADPPTQIPVSQDVTVVLDKVIHNNGTWGPVDATTTTEVTPPTNCTVRPEVHTQQFYNVPVSVDILHHEPFVIHCYELGPHTFTFDDTVAVKSPHVIDTDLTNNDWNGTQLTVEAMALADVKITGASFVAPPTKIPLGEDADVTLQKHIHNNGSWGPVDIAIDSDATAPTGCTIAPKSVPASISGVPVSVDQVVDEVWTINCTQNTIPKTFVFNASIDVSTAHVYDPNGVNNAVVKYLTVTDDPADPQGDMDGDGWTNGAEAVIGTDPADACPDDPSDDAWPPDINNDRSVNILDVLLFKGPISGAYDSRYDLNADSAINILDVLLYKPLIGMACTP
jgi:hypothetical protein